MSKTTETITLEGSFGPVTVRYTPGPADQLCDICATTWLPGLPEDEMAVAIDTGADEDLVAHPSCFAPIAHRFES